MTATRSHRPVVLSIAGSDSAGLAGSAMDVRTISAMGGHAATVITANTAQNSQRMLGLHPVEHSVLASQLKAVATLPIAAIKIGMVASQEQASTIQQFLQTQSAPVVLDPIIATSSGFSVFAEQRHHIESLKALLPLCNLITPNLPEADLLTGTKEPQAIAEILKSWGAKAVLVKGGHAAINENGGNEESTYCDDFFSNTLPDKASQQFWLRSARINTQDTRGTGCALSSAIATALALGYSLEDAVTIGKMAINQGLREHYGLQPNSDTDNATPNTISAKGSKDTKGTKGTLSIQDFPRCQQDLPQLIHTAPSQDRTQPHSALPTKHFPSCGSHPLGLYPIVDRAEWLARLLPTGITTAQLRVKDLTGAALEREIQTAIATAEQYQCRLFINDYWEIAIKHGAYGIHLGQEDLDTADINALLQAGLRLGISSHCHYEVARALSFRPSYLACGPIYPTTTKIMPWQPQQLDGLRYWQDMLDYPLVAIGGINAERLAGVANTGVSGIAMITAITQAENPEQTCEDFQAVISANRPQ